LGGRACFRGLRPALRICRPYRDLRRAMSRGCTLAVPVLSLETCIVVVQAPSGATYRWPWPSGQGKRLPTWETRPTAGDITPRAGRRLGGPEIPRRLPGCGLLGITRSGAERPRVSWSSRPAHVGQALLGRRRLAGRAAPSPAYPLQSQAAEAVLGFAHFGRLGKVVEDRPVMRRRLLHHPQFVARLGGQQAQGRQVIRLL